MWTAAHREKYRQSPENARQSVQQARARRLAAGTCYDCNNPPEPMRSMCRKHLQAHARRQKEVRQRQKQLLWQWV